MRSNPLSSLWIAVLAIVVSLTSCDPMSSVDYKVHNMTGDTVTVAMYMEILSSDYQGFTIEQQDSLVGRYGQDDSVNVAILAPNQALAVHYDWSGLYREDFIVPLWQYISSIRVGCSVRPRDSWDNEPAWHLKVTGGKRFQGESRYYDLYLRP